MAYYETDQYHGLDENIIGEGTSDDKTRTLCSHIQRQIDQNNDYLIRRGARVSYSEYNNRNEYENPSNDSLQNAGRIWSCLNSSMEHPDFRDLDDHGKARFHLPFYISPLTEEVTIYMFGRVLPPSTAALDDGDISNLSGALGLKKPKRTVIDRHFHVDATLSAYLQPGTPLTGRKNVLSETEQWSTEINSNDVVIPSVYSVTLNVEALAREMVDNTLIDLVFSFQSYTYYNDGGVGTVKAESVHDYADAQNKPALNNLSIVNPEDLGSSDFAPNTVAMNVNDKPIGSIVYNEADGVKASPYIVVDNFYSGEINDLRRIWYSRMVSAIQPLSWTIEEHRQSGKSSGNYEPLPESKANAGKVVDSDAALINAKNTDTNFTIPKLQAIGPKPSEGDSNNGTVPWPDNHNKVWRNVALSENNFNNGTRNIYPGSVLDEQSFMLDRVQDPTIEVHLYYLLCEFSMNKNSVEGGDADVSDNVGGATYEHHSLRHWRDGVNHHRHKGDDDSRYVTSATTDIQWGLSLFQRPFDMGLGTSDLHTVTETDQSQHVFWPHVAQAYPMMKSLSSAWIHGTLFEQFPKEDAENYHYNEGLIDNKDLYLMERKSIEIDVSDDSIDYSKPVHGILYLEDYNDLEPKNGDDHSHMDVDLYPSVPESTFIYAIQSTWYELGRL